MMRTERAIPGSDVIKKKGVRTKSLIGWREWCVIQSLGLPPIAAKIDTGARTSSIHAFNVVYFSRDDQRWVRFHVHPVQKKRSPDILCEARVIEMRKVVSSNGIPENRPVIEACLVMGSISFSTEVTLTNRDMMGYRMLIGRKALSRRFIVDTSLSWALGGPEEI